MRKLMMIAATLGMLSVSAPAAQAQKLDANGKCHDAKGKFAKAEVCIGAANHHTYKLDKKGKCRDETGHFAEAINCPHNPTSAAGAH